MKYDVIIAAGGSGKRMGHELPKQFIPIKDKPIIIHTIEKFAYALPDCHFVVAMHTDWISYWQELQSTWLQNLTIDIADGGTERFHSVQNALHFLRNDSIVLIHDAARPLVDVDLIKRSIAACATYDAVIPVVPVFESMRRVSSAESSIVNRNEYVLIQTPQCFNSDVLKKAYSQEYRASFTDDSSVVEAAGYQIHLIPGNRKNIKITTDEDLQLASCWLT